MSNQENSIQIQVGINKYFQREIGKKKQLLLPLKCQLFLLSLSLQSMQRPLAKTIQCFVYGLNFSDTIKRPVLVVNLC